MKFTIKRVQFDSYLQFLVLSIPVLMITGPFLPDLFLSISSISFLIFMIMKKSFFLNKKIFQLFLFFFFILLLSGLFSDYKSKSLITSIAYLRFGLFILVINFLIKEKKNFINRLYLVLISLFTILFFDGIFQKFTGSNILGVAAPYGRITSLFGEDIKLGGYIARLTPLLVALSVYLNSDKRVTFIIITISIILTLISGERTSLLMLMMFLIGYLFFIEISFKIKLFYFTVPLILIITTLVLSNEIRHRVLLSTINHINIFNDKSFYKTIKNKDGKLIVYHRDSTLFPRVYHMYYQTSIKILKDNILIGSGPRTYQFKSKEKKYFTSSSHEGWLNFVKKHNSEKLKEILEIHNEQIKQISKSKKYLELKNDKKLIYKKEYIDWLKSYGISHIDFEERIKDIQWLNGLGVLEEKQVDFTDISGVNSHPHNTYLQLLSETGLMGFFFILGLWLFCIFKSFSKEDFYFKCLLLSLIINLFPFMFSGNFFNNWLSILYFYPIGFLTIKYTTKYS